MWFLGYLKNCNEQFVETNQWHHIAFHFKSIKVGKEGGKTQKFEFTKIFFIIFGTFSVAMRNYNSKK